MLYVYTHKITHRNKYIFNLMFKDLLEIDFLLMNDVDEFKKYNGPKLSYTGRQVSDELHFTSCNLLFETGISDQDITVLEHKNIPVFYNTHKTSTLPFDVFAASFYLVSRYEEYLPHIRDEHDRFEAKHSLAFANNFLHLPVVNIYAQWIKESIQTKFPDVVFPKHTYNFISTIDIDNAYAYSEKGVVRAIGGYLKSMVTLNVDEIITRTKVLLKIEKDPYDTYDYQLEMIKKYKLKCIYFFLVGDYGVNDKNLPFSNLKFQALIKDIGDYAQIGIHPSYGSNTKKSQLKKEINRLSRILHRDITNSRQHFLKIRLPETYRNLIDADITDDYTMGYASHVGFRAGICSSFNFYDLDMELETKLKVHPFAVMEGTLNYVMNIDPKQAIGIIKPLIDEVKKVNGTFISLWHNDTLNNQNKWKGWQAVYEEMVKYAVEQPY